MPTIRVIFFGSRQLEQALTQRLASRTHDIDLAAAARNPADLFPLLKQHQPQLLLLENTPDQPHILSLVQNTRAHFPQVKVLLLAKTVDVAQIQRLIMMGIAGCLLVDSSLDGLDISISLINSGKLTLAAEVTQALLAKQ